MLNGAISNFTPSKDFLIRSSVRPVGPETGCSHWLGVKKSHFPPIFPSHRHALWARNLSFEHVKWGYYRRQKYWRVFSAHLKIRLYFGKRYLLNPWVYSNAAYIFGISTLSWRKWVLLEVCMTSGSKACMTLKICYFSQLFTIFKVKQAFKPEVIRTSKITHFLCLEVQIPNM